MECICGRRERRSTAPFLRPRSIECPCEAGRSSAQVPEGDPMRLRRNAREFGWSCRRSSPTHACDPETPASAYRGFCSGLIKSIPTRLIWPDDCCARAATGQNVAMARPAMNWRRRMAPPKDTRAQTMQQPNTFLTAGQLETIFNPLQPNVCSGSKAALTAPKRDFRFAPINRHQTTGTAGPLRANTRPVRPCRWSRRGSACVHKYGQMGTALARGVAMRFDRRDFLKASTAATLLASAPADLIASAAHAAAPSDGAGAHRNGRHLLPTVSDTRMLIKASFDAPLTRARRRCASVTPRFAAA